MNILLILAYLFFIGSTLGWCLELVYRRFFSKANPSHKWINPGFCIGPYVPLYGFGLCMLYLMASLGQIYHLDQSIVTRLILFFVMAVSMTVIEYIAGVFCVEYLSVRLWDYSKEHGNIQGIICPKFSFYWALLGAGYYFFIHPQILNALQWLSENLAFSFFIGFFFGVFAVDVIYSANILAKIRKYAKDNKIIVKYELLKAHIKIKEESIKQKTKFLFPLKTDKPLLEHIKQAKNAIESKVKF